MFESNRRGTTVLYLVVGLILLTLLATTPIPAPAAAALMGAYMALIFITARSWQLAAAFPEMTRRTPRITESARLAVHRVANQSVFLPNYQLQDVGLIIDERRPDGMRLRHSRFLSFDEESIRPYIVLNHHSSQEPEPVLLRFEMNDPDGTARYIYEMEQVLRPGENLIIPDYRLRLRGNTQVNSSVGSWEVGVSINGYTFALHRFNLLPSVADRARQFSVDGEAPSARLLLENEEELPLSLEELLGQHGRR